ncbi:ComEC/Rec2 family competence protein [Candidatus Azambacteria bacterium]|nr:ComEC/Rec2 family competence protein [Candidatus Azambacteria bacterium]
MTKARVFLVFLVAFGLGISLGSVVPLGVLAGAGLLGAGIAALISSRPFFVLFLALGFGLGVLRSLGPVWELPLGWLLSSLLALKASFLASLSRLFRPPSDSFLAALLVGERRSIPNDLLQAFIASGTVHIIALSGYNISIVTGAFRSALSWLGAGRRLRFWLTLAAILLFVLLVGAGASVVRAAVMGILVVLARSEGRLYAPWNALVFAGAVMLLFDPGLFEFDIGFQLSFAATAGIFLFAKYFEKKLERLPKAAGIREVLVLTLSASIATMPLILYHFSRFSLYAIPANLLILPTVPVTMLFGFLAGVIGMVSEALAQAPALIASLLLLWEETVARFWASLPGANLRLESFSLGLLVVVYGGLAWWGWRLSRRSFPKYAAKPHR